MAFSLYQSLKTVPADLKEAARQLPPHGLAALLAAGGAVRHARPGLEHHDVDVGRLVLRRRLRGDLGRRQHAGSCRASAPMSRWRMEQRDIVAVVLGDRGDAGGDPGLRPAAVPPAGRLVGQVPLRDDRRRDRRRSLAAAADAAHAAAEPAGRCRRRYASRHSAACALALPAAPGAAGHATVARWSMRCGSWCSLAVLAWALAQIVGFVVRGPELERPAAGGRARADHAGPRRRC